MSRTVKDRQKQRLEKRMKDIKREIESKKQRDNEGKW